jgi:surface polysaccharide O-acyltransferase-like enzyme
MLDLARLLAVYAIVWLHNVQSPALERSRALGRFAVPLFVFLTIFLVFEGVSRNPWRSWGQYARSRAVRLYLPFLAWSGIYLAFKAIKGRLLPGEPNDYPGIEILWLGACYHLWFLPFILAVSLLAFGAAKLVVARPGWVPLLVVVFVAAGLALGFLPSPARLATLSEYWALVPNALPAVAWGLALAVACRTLGAGALEDRRAALGGAVAFALATAWVWHAGRARLAETVAGLAVLLVALTPVDQRRFARFGRAGSLAFGIYLCHVLWIKIFQAAAMKAGLPISWQRDLGVFLLAATASTLLAWSLSRGRWTRWLIA